MRPLILVTNDDGIHAPGIHALAEALAEVGEVIVSAPADQQSAVGHGISLMRPLRVRTLHEGWFAVAGSPADAVLLGLFELCAPRRPALVISGINHGANLGCDVFYSGTVAGAVEGAIHGLPAIAISQILPTEDAETEESSRQAVAWDPQRTPGPKLTACLDQTARFAASLARAVLEDPLPPGTTLNVNVPDRPASQFAWTRLGNRTYRGQVVRRFDPRAIPYYWIGGPPENRPDLPGSDGATIAAGLISITPLSLDWTGAAPPRAQHLRLQGFERSGEPT